MDLAYASTAINNIGTTRCNNTIVAEYSPTIPTHTQTGYASVGYFEREYVFDY